MITTVNDLYLAQQFKFSRGRYNILDCGVRTGKTYWAIHNLKDFTRDNLNRRILFLTDTTALKTSIIHDYADHCCDADSMWECDENSWSSEFDNKIGVMCYQGLGMKVIKNDLQFLNSIDVICWDECDSIFDFAATAFARARKFDFARKTSSNGQILNLIQEHSTNKDYMPLILLGFWQKIINENRILCIGLSATPERAKVYYNTLVDESYKGKIDTGYRAASDIYFKNIIEHVQKLVPIPGIGYWCYSPSIEHNLNTVRAANNQGFHAIEIHSERNEKYPLNDEQKNVIDCIDKMHMVPYGYDFVVVTRAFERGIDIVDPRFKHLIVDSYYQTDRIQAARQTFPYQRHVKILSDEVPIEFRNRWITNQQGKELAEYMAVPDIDVNNNANGRSQARTMTWNKLQTLLPSIGYKVQKKRKRVAGAANPLTCYYISGDWHDVEVVAEKGFMDLVAAKSNEALMISEDLI